MKFLHQNSHFLAWEHVRLVQGFRIFLFHLHSEFAGRLQISGHDKALAIVAWSLAVYTVDKVTVATRTNDMADDSIFLGASRKPDDTYQQAESLLLNRANRHGVVAGATGTGKTVTLQIMAQGFSDAGVPVFCADVKGDLSGICVPGSPNEKLLARAAARWG